PETGQDNNNNVIETDALERFSERFFMEFRKFEWSVRLPIRSETELKIAEEKLAQKGFRDKLTKWCISLGGVDFKTHTRRILSRIFQQDLAVLVS
ncbi:unnamed protein product, partial [Allacma fusca]